MKTLVFALTFVVLLLVAVVPVLASHGGPHLASEAAVLADNPEISAARQYMAGRAAEESAQAQAEAGLVAANPELSAATSQRSRDAATARYNALAENYAALSATTSQRSRDAATARYNALAEN